MRFYCIITLGILLGVATALVGCASVPPGAGKHVSFSDYAEAVFRHQNEVSNRLLMINDTEQSPETVEFQQAEEAMDSACQLLNEYAERENDGESSSWRFQARVQDSIQICDNCVQRMELLLNQMEQRNSAGELK